MSVMDWLDKEESRGEEQKTSGARQLHYRPWPGKGPQHHESPPLSLNEAVAAGFPGFVPDSAIPEQPVLPDLAELEERVIGALRTVFDPEIPVNIYDLGLIYGLTIDQQRNHVDIQMTLTAPGCPVAQTFPGEVEQRMVEVQGIDSAKVELVWDPPWTRERMSEAALLTLGML